MSTNDGHLTLHWRESSNDIHWNLPTSMMSETHDIQGILEKHYLKGSFSHFKENGVLSPSMNWTDLLFG